MSSKASMQFMIPAESRRQLVEELGYYPEEVAVMDPNLAVSILKKGMRRPFGDNPMPEKWKSKAYQKASTSSSGQLSGAKKAAAVLVSAAVLGLAGYVVWLAGAEDRKREAARRRLIEKRNGWKIR